MSNEKWSEWIDWSGRNNAPVTPGSIVVIKTRAGFLEGGKCADFYWHHDGHTNDIIAYRYKIKEPESDMHPDLEWLAAVEDEWCDDYSHAYVNHYDGAPNHITFNDGQGYTKNQWLQARKDLGLDSDAVADEDEEECLQLAYERMKGESVPSSIKQLRYQDAKGEDWIDEFARTKSVDEFRGAMSFNIGKYNRRAGKKDDIPKELDKIIDYCRRWKDYELGLKG